MLVLFYVVLGDSCSVVYGILVMIRQTFFFSFSLLPLNLFCCCSCVVVVVRFQFLVALLVVLID